MRRAPLPTPLLARISNCRCFRGQQRLRDFPPSPTDFAFFRRSAPPRGEPTPLRLHFPLKIGVTVTFPLQGRDSLPTKSGSRGGRGRILIFPIPPLPRCLDSSGACNFRVISVCHHPAAPAPPAQISHALHRPICVSRVELDLTSS